MQNLRAVTSAKTGCKMYEIKWCH